MIVSHEHHLDTSLSVFLVLKYRLLFSRPHASEMYYKTIIYIVVDNI